MGQSELRVLFGVIYWQHGLYFHCPTEHGEVFQACVHHRILPGICNRSGESKRWQENPLQPFPPELNLSCPEGESYYGNLSGRLSVHPRNRKLQERGYNEFLWGYLSVLN